MSARSKERQNCLLQAADSELDIPPEVLASLPSRRKQIRAKAEQAASTRPRSAGRIASAGGVLVMMICLRAAHADRDRPPAAVEVRLQLRLQGHALGRALQSAG